MTPMLPKTNTGAAIGGSLVVIVVFVLQALAAQLNAGAVPIPAEYAWLLPLAVAFVAGLLAVLTPHVGPTGQPSVSTRKPQAPTE